jgi:hypothetical protein
MIIIAVEEGIISTRNIQAFDAYGRSFGLKHAKRLSDHSVEISISGWAQGTYFIRAKVDDRYKTFAVVKRGTQ